MSIRRTDEAFLFRINEMARWIFKLNDMSLDSWRFGARGILSPRDILILQFKFNITRRVYKQEKIIHCYFIQSWKFKDVILMKRVARCVFFFRSSLILSSNIFHLRFLFLGWIFFAGVLFLIIFLGRNKEHGGKFTRKVFFSARN